MTETEWLACTDPEPMLDYLQGKASDRKMRLFAVACCRRIWAHIPESCNRDAVGAVEDFLDGHLPAPALEVALVASSAVEWHTDGSGRRSEPGYWVVKYLGRGFYKMTAAASALLVVTQILFMADEQYGRNAGHDFNGCFYSAAGVFLSPFQWPLPVPAIVEAERVTLAVFLRCIFGNPFRDAPATDPVWLEWNNGTVKRLAEAIYEERSLPSGTLNNAHLAVLADALEEAGCTNADILDHCRQPGEHVRGCWVVDMLLGKE